MNLFGVQVPETIEVFGIQFFANPVTVLIVALPLIFAVALLTYWISQRSTARAVYKSDYNFYDNGQVATIESNPFLTMENPPLFFANDGQMISNNVFFEHVEQLQETHPQNDGQMISNNVFFEHGEQLQETHPQIDTIDSEDDVTKPVQVPYFYQTAPAYLTYVGGGDHLPKKLAIEGNESIIRIGRKQSTCELVLDDRRVSRLHSTITSMDDQFYIIDEGSSGGTFVNYKKLKSIDNYKLFHNDIINFNEIEYRFEVMTEIASKVKVVPSVLALPSL